jgi:hypothetical protein
VLMPDATQRAVASASVRGSLAVGSGVAVADAVGTGVAGSSVAGPSVAAGVSTGEPTDSSGDPSAESSADASVDGSSIVSGLGLAAAATCDGVVEIAAGAGDGVPRASI